MKPLVMVVDDDSGIINLLSIVLKNSGYNVLTASNGIDALNLLSRSFTPDIIITDYCMPRLKGSELIETIYTFEELKSIPAVMITGSDSDKITLPRTDNFRGIIKKPFRVNNLLQTINDLLNENGYGSSVYTA